MADDSDNGDSGNDERNNDNDDSDLGEISTGYGGDEFANSERGVYSSPNVYSFSNTGAEGSLPLDTTGTQNRNTSRAYNQAISGGAFTPLPSMGLRSQSGIASEAFPGTLSTLGRTAIAPGLTPQQMMPKEEEKKEEQKPKGGGTPMPQRGPAVSMPVKDNPYAVERNPFPFTPVMPVAGSGVQKAFFDAQNDLLKTMLPYWNK